MNNRQRAAHSPAVQGESILVDRNRGGLGGGRERSGATEEGKGFLVVVFEAEDFDSLLLAPGAQVGVKGGVVGLNFDAGALLELGEELVESDNGERAS